jgi:hypothetical protein
LVSQEKINPFIFKNRHGLNFECEKLLQNQSIEYLFKEKKIITGIFYLIGPDTNFCEILINNEIIKVIMTDQMGFYRRVAYQSIGYKETAKVKILHPMERIKVNFKKESMHKNSDACNYILGLSSLSNKIKNI